MIEQARSIQFVWFIPGDPPPASKLFDSLLGREPDAFQKIAPPQAPLPVTVQHILIDGMVHRLQSHAGRIDYFIEPSASGPTFPLIPNPWTLVYDALDRVNKVSEIIGDIARAALIVTLAKKLGSAEETAAEFTQLFDGKIDVSSAYDLMFQMSKTTSIGAVGKINRLLRWTGEIVSYLPFVSNALPSTLLSSATETHYLTYMIDANTVPTATSRFPSPLHSEVFQALIEAAEELAKIEKIGAIT